MDGFFSYPFKWLGVVYRISSKFEYGKYSNLKSTISVKLCSSGSSELRLLLSLDDECISMFSNIIVEYRASKAASSSSSIEHSRISNIFEYLILSNHMVGYIQQLTWKICEGLVAPRFNLVEVGGDWECNFVEIDSLVWGTILPIARLIRLDG